MKRCSRTWDKFINQIVLILNELRCRWCRCWCRWVPWSFNRVYKSYSKMYKNTFSYAHTTFSHININISIIYIYISGQRLFLETSTLYCTVSIVKSQPHNGCTIKIQAQSKPICLSGTSHKCFVVLCRFHFRQMSRHLSIMSSCKLECVTHSVCMSQSLCVFYLCFTIGHSMYIYMCVYVIVCIHQWRIRLNFNSHESVMHEMASAKGILNQQ